MPLRYIYDEHREIIRRIEHLARLAATDPLPLDELLSERHALAQFTNDHLSREADRVLEPMRASSDPEHKAIVRHYIEDMMSVRQESSGHYRRWTAASLRKDPIGYRADLRRMEAMVRERHQWEETVFLPIAARFAPARPPAGRG